MMQPVKEYLKDPASAIGARLEAMKRLPGVEIDILHQIFSFRIVAQHR